MSTCMSCGSPLEWSPSGQGHARCTRCAGLYAGAEGALQPVRLEAPGGGFNPEFQAIFEQQLGFGARQVPRQPPSYWQSGGGGGAAPANPIQRIIQLSIVAFVFMILAGTAAYVGWIVWSALPH